MDAVVPLRPAAATAVTAAAAGEGLNGTEDALLSTDDVFLRRRNNTLAALGKLKRSVVCGKVLYLSPDRCVIFAPAGITAFLLCCNTVIAWPILSFFDFFLLYSLVIGGFVFAALVSCTDPGVYPRLGPGDIDPVGDDKRYIFCRVCHLRRPPRTSHCYTCGVCVLEHDHHCGIIGGCVGLRSLRWFTLFVVCIGLGAIVACSWMIRFLSAMISQMPVHNRSATTIPLNMTGPMEGGAPVDMPFMMNKPGFRQARARNTSNTDEPNLVGIGACMVFFLDLIVLLLVGGMAVMYIFLMLTSTTRRESKKGMLYGKKNGVCNNLTHSMFPPPSLLEGSATDDMVNLV
ncbi:hypothetical protein STCU_04533 [Strigomonas culicis]|uniref:Palmitoyltransferase n=1 Tax=Strigomonas culicis TaxID=28005 RepID=S9TUI7_9TRYP|nr:hypothetical protein STCU_08357 [Strigomonas culicis]EPY28535.1 hypothetical protein STCU_05045 [Strigomonas culicis]EPY29484.1 hypothetical protein STCU_04533 [Strigomonas culicis]|eukprot:EPY22082.1 hypothetical protein STCU_08357 [Strigomonas culicis]